LITGFCLFPILELPRNQKDAVRFPTQKTTEKDRLVLVLSFLEKRVENFPLRQVSFVLQTRKFSSLPRSILRTTT
jgi:hypothetical protein